MNSKTGNNLADKHLVDKVLSSDTRAFGLIIKNTERLVAQIVFKMINHPEDRKDIVQDIYLKVFHKLGSFRYQSKLSTWIAQVSYNTCFDYLQKKKLVLTGNLEESSHTEQDGDDEILFAGIRFSETSVLTDHKELSVILKTETEKLPPVYKTLITLYHQEELSYEEIIQVTGLPMGTIKSYLSRARKKLRDSLLVNYKKEEL